MKLSENTLKILFNYIHSDIEEYSNSTIETIFKDLDFASYPPNIEFTDAEKEQLLKLESNDFLKSALKKVLSNNAGEIMFSFFNLVDGSTDPDNEKNWTGIKLVDDDDSIEPIDEFLHDGFYDSYWDWKTKNNSTEI